MMRGSVRAMLAAGISVALLAGTVQAWAASPWVIQPSPSPGTTSHLASVGTTSATNAWAVGATDQAALIEHYDGTSWQQVAAPAPGISSELRDMKIHSSTDIWAVGGYATDQSDDYPLIEHYNGTAWNQLDGDPLVVNAALYGVAVPGSSSAFAVGVGDFGGPGVIEHYNGHTWKKQASDDPSGGDQFLHDVTAPAAGIAWAVGRNGDTLVSLIEHYYNSKWHLISSPTRGYETDLVGATNAGTSDVWAVGDWYSSLSSPERTIILHWDGQAWSIVASPNRGTDSWLTGVKAVSADDVWAVGGYLTKGGTEQTLIEHFDGTSWTVQASPNVPGTDTELDGVAGTSPTNVFAVGSSSSNQASTLVMHCC